MRVPQAYLDYIRISFPEAPLHETDFNQDGLINDVVIVGGDRVFRFPKTDWARDSLLHEARVLDLVRQHVSVPIPQFEHVDKELAAYRFLPGEPLTRTRLLRLSADRRRSVLADLAGFLRNVHAIPSTAAAAAHIEVSDAARTRDDWLALLAKVEDVLFPLLMRHQRQWVTEHFAPVVNNTLDLAYQPRLIHGDLGVYHVLCDPYTTELAGVIDFGTAGLGDPATDLATLLASYGESLVADMLPAYPELRAYLERARFWMGTLELQWAFAGITRDDKALLAAHIGGARDVLPPGFPVMTPQSQ